MPNLSISEAIDIVTQLFRRKKEIQIEADGAEDRFYLSELEWAAIERLWEACKQEF